MQEKQRSSAYWALRLALGIVPIVAGLDKFTNVLARWEDYLSPIARSLLPFSPTTFMHLAGLVEVAVGAGILLGRARIFGWVAMAWLLGIAVNLILTGHYLDVAARDVVMAVAAFALAKLAQAEERVHAPAPLREPRPAGAHA